MGWCTFLLQVILILHVGRSGSSSLCVLSYCHFHEKLLFIRDTVKSYFVFFFSVLGVFIFYLIYVRSEDSTWMKIQFLSYRLWRCINRAEWHSGNAPVLSGVYMVFSIPSSKSQDNILMKPWLLSSKFIPVHHSLPFNAI